MARDLSNLRKFVSPEIIFGSGARLLAGAAQYIEQGCDTLVCVGGGSAMDLTKGIGIVVTNGGHILEYEGVDKIDQAVPPLILIPTTAGSSADVSQFTIITNQAERVKIAIISKTIVPDVALIDPETTLSMDPFLTAWAAILIFHMENATLLS